MRYLIFFACFCLVGSAGAQISIYDCSLYDKVTQSMLESAGSEYYAPCVEMDSEIDNSSSPMKTIRSSSAIHLKSGFHGKGHLDLKVQPKAGFEVALMNYSSVNHILRYEKFELGIKLPATLQDQIDRYLSETPGPDSSRLNPFVEWDIRIQAVFNKSGSSYQEFVDGFYTREMVRNYTTDRWDDQGTDYPFRVRFAPSKNGNWTCAINVEIRGGLEVLTSDVFTFKVVESGNPGFAKVHANNKNFERGGQIFMPVGTNLPFDGGPGSAFKQWNNSASYLEDYPMSYWERYVQLVDSYGTAGGKYIRIMNAAPSSEVEFEKLGNYHDRLMFASEMDRLLDVCHQNGMMIDFCLMYHTPMTVQHNADLGYAWDYGDYWPYPDWPSERPAYCYSSAFNSSEPMDMVYNEEAFKYIKQRYRYYIARYGYSTDIYLFDLVNEPWHMSQNTDLEIDPYKNDATTYGDSVRAAVSKMQEGLSKYIKIHLEHKQHLLGAIGWMSSSYPNYHKQSGDKTVNDLSWEAEHIDVVCINSYAERPDRMIISKDNDMLGNDNNGFYSEEESFAFDFHRLFERYGKPVFLPEVGFGANSGLCANSQGHYIDVMQYGFSGLAGFNAWAGWRTDSLDERTLWPATIRSQFHMNGVDVINTLSNGDGQWLQGREVQRNHLLAEQQYYRSNDKESCVGYVYNRTFNPKTLGCSALTYDGTSNRFSEKILVTSEMSNLRVQGLKNNTDYKVYWYSYKDGNYIGDYCVNTTNHGELLLDHTLLFPWISSEIEGSPTVPDLNPVVWYVIKQNNCDGGRSGSESGDSTGTIDENRNIYDLENSGRDTTVTGSSLNGNSELEWLNIVPNPFSEEIRINAGKAIGEIIIKDAQGKIVEREEITTKLATINTAHLSPGLYFLYATKWNLTFKIIKL